MSTAIAKNFQVGSDTTATNNFTIFQPATPDGTLRIGNGNTGITSSLLALTSGGNLGIGTSSPTNYGAGYKTVSANGSSSGVFELQANGTAQAILVADNSDLQIQALGARPIRFFTSGNKRMEVDSSGNLGLGVTPSAWVGKAFQVGTASMQSNNNSQIVLAANRANNGSDYYITSNFATAYQQLNGAHTWYTAPSGTAGNAISFTQAMTLDASGNLGLGTSSPDSNAGYAFMTTNGSSGSGFHAQSGGTTVTKIEGVSGSTNITAEGARNIQFYTNSSERARIDSSGNLLVGTNSGSNHIIAFNAAQGTAILNVFSSNTGVTTSQFFGITTTGENAAGCAQMLRRNGGTGRSLNAAGTINASGADYAEYMTKAGDFTIAKGDVVGIDANGKLTNVFADAVSFAVKSTDPSYVGGDVWGNEDSLGMSRPDDNATDAEKQAFEAALEAARQKVDRIAFAGQVPVNVTGATPGQYIVPANDNGEIKGEAVSNPTFEQYRLAVGKVIAIEEDGRARIIVKVA